MFNLDRREIGKLYEPDFGYPFNRHGAYSMELVGPEKTDMAGLGQAYPTAGGPVIGPWPIPRAPRSMVATYIAQDKPYLPWVRGPQAFAALPSRRFFGRPYYGSYKN